ncbi:type IX secretion system protein PorN/GldN [Aurantibacillus circumpalustris]|uniref:type IX secretion system ring protein PorN/GldN n=1 Tax=Aurantibacillus circumpalustris TaxID=3036359 RepID=UPI00295BB543|nr:gliding motility protein GldN [Aurantibacillus circumpalustris]
MRFFVHIKLIALFVFLVNSINAQQSIFQPGDYKDGIYDKENAVNRRFIPYTHLREGDVIWEKRIWRVIDIREKVNQPLYFPVDPNVSRISIMQLMTKYILSGQIIAFHDEEFLSPYEKAEIREKMVIKSDSTDSEQFDDQGNSVFIRVAGAIDSTWLYNNFCEIELKEDWFFDKQKSTLEVRIIGLGFGAAIKGKEDLGCVNQFYVYFPACRPFFAKHEVFNVRNDSERRTFEDVFWKRQFASSIKKESNVYDRKIEQYAKGLDALLESDKIKGDIFKFEHDLWHF